MGAPEAASLSTSVAEPRWMGRRGGRECGNRWGVPHGQAETDAPRSCSATMMRGGGEGGGAQSSVARRAPPAPAPHNATYAGGIHFSFRSDATGGRGSRCGGELGEVVPDGIKCAKQLSIESRYPLCSLWHRISLAAKGGMGSFIAVKPAFSFVQHERGNDGGRDAQRQKPERGQRQREEGQCGRRDQHEAGDQWDQPWRCGFAGRPTLRHVRAQIETRERRSRVVFAGKLRKKWNPIGPRHGASRHLKVFAIGAQTNGMASAKWTTVEVPFQLVSGKRALSRKQLVDDPWLNEFVTRFWHCFREDDYGFWLVYEPPE
jgi:hypothetical protein